MSFLWVFIGGGLGSVTRYLFGALFTHLKLPLPYATLSANLVSCLLFALTLYAFKDKGDIPAYIRLLILTGVCGGLSTFSTFSFETFELLKQSQYFWALGNILLNTVFCILIFYIFK